MFGICTSVSVVSFVVLLEMSRTCIGAMLEVASLQGVAEDVMDLWWQSLFLLSIAPGHFCSVAEDLQDLYQNGRGGGQFHQG